MDHQVEQLDQVIKQLYGDQRKADAEDFQSARLLKVLMETQGWREYQRVLDRRIQVFADAMMTAAGSVDRLVALEYVKGTMSGLILAKDLPSTIIDGMAAYAAEQKALGLRGEDDDDDGA